MRQFEHLLLSRLLCCTQDASGSSVFLTQIQRIKIRTPIPRTTPTDMQLKISVGLIAIFLWEQNNGLVENLSSTTTLFRIRFTIYEGLWNISKLICLECFKWYKGYLSETTQKAVWKNSIVNFIGLVLETIPSNQFWSRPC